MGKIFPSLGCAWLCVFRAAGEAGGNLVVPRGASPRQRPWATRSIGASFFLHTTTFRVLLPVATFRSSPSTVSWSLFLGKATTFPLLQVQVPCIRFFVIRHDVRSGSPSQIAGSQPAARQKRSVAGNGCSGTSCVTRSVNEATQQPVIERTHCNNQHSGACICSRNHSSLPQHAGS